jgi:hypothetical protein
MASEGLWHVLNHCLCWTCVSLAAAYQPGTVPVELDHAATSELCPITISLVLDLRAPM